jgi:hypothetical protein
MNSSRPTRLGSDRPPSWKQVPAPTYIINARATLYPFLTDGIGSVPSPHRSPPLHALDAKKAIRRALAPSAIPRLADHPISALTYRTFTLARPYCPQTKRLVAEAATAQWSAWAIRPSPTTIVVGGIAARLWTNSPNSARGFLDRLPKSKLRSATFYPQDRQRQHASERAPQGGAILPDQILACNKANE